MEILLDEEEQRESDIIRELLATMTEQEKKIFRVFLTTRKVTEEIKKYK